MERLVGECMARGGNAVIAMRFDAGEIKIYAKVLFISKLKKLCSIFKI